MNFTIRTLAFALSLAAACADSHDASDDEPADWVEFCTADVINYCESGASDLPRDECIEDLNLDCVADDGWPCLPIPTRAQARECLHILDAYYRSGAPEEEFPEECDFWACFFVD